MENDGRFSDAFLWLSCRTLGWESGTLRRRSRRRLATYWRNSGRPRVWGSQGRATRWLGGYGELSHEKTGFSGKKSWNGRGWRISQMCWDVQPCCTVKSTRDHLSRNFHLWLSLYLWARDIIGRLWWYVSLYIFLEAGPNFIMFIHFYCGE